MCYYIVTGRDTPKDERKVRKMRTISRTEYNTRDNTVGIWNYYLNKNGGIIRSECIASCPIAPWADKYAIGSALMGMVIEEGRWEFGR